MMDRLDMSLDDIIKTTKPVKKAPSKSLAEPAKKNGGAMRQTVAQKKGRRSAPYKVFQELAQMMRLGRAGCTC
jgi:hypothetical protein